MGVGVVHWWPPPLGSKGGKGGYGQTRRCGHGQFQNTHLHLHNTYFSYLILFLQQYSLPNSGVDLYPFISAGGKG